MGSFSSRRFELLNRMSLLPHEEILRKEAMLPSEDDGYVPGCEINFEWVDVSVEQITYEKTPNASSPIASYLDSSMKPKYNLSTGVNEEL
ncbi:hypothetical protein FXO38_23992 [Capsicum annuum]|nr:hypothetical protein FXO38_23992 [Capsicum annuum]